MWRKREERERAGCLFVLCEVVAMVVVCRWRVKSDRGGRRGTRERAREIEGGRERERERREKEWRCVCLSVCLAVV